MAQASRGHDTVLPDITTEERRIDKVRIITKKNIGQILDYGKGSFIPGTNIFLETTRLKSEMEFHIDAGTYSISPNWQSIWGFNLRRTCLQLPPLWMELENTKQIDREATKFFNKLELYEKHKMRKMRSLLLYSLPGMGKTAAINRVCQDWVDRGEAIALFLDSSQEPDFEDVLRAFFSKVVLPEEVNKLFLVMEDVNGYMSDDEQVLRKVSPRLLSLLDGSVSIFPLPTFLILTTNFGNAVPLPLLRPGRVDKIILLNPPTLHEQVQLLQFFAGDEKHLYELAQLKEDEVATFRDRLTPYKMFGPAHLKEVVFRAELDDIPLFEAAKNIKAEFMDIQLRSDKLKSKVLDDGITGMGFGVPQPSI